MNFDIIFEDLSSATGLGKLDGIFLSYLHDIDTQLYSRLLSYRKIVSTEGLSSLPRKEYSEFLVSLSYILDDFISELFHISKENLNLKKTHSKFDKIYECRRKFVQRYAIKKYTKEKLQGLDFKQISFELKELIGEITEQSISDAVLLWQTDSKKYSKHLEIASVYCAFMVHNNSSLMLFDVPMPTCSSNHIREHKITQLKSKPYLGFDYRDHEQSIDKAIAHSKYCIYCHKQEKDSCSLGMKNTYPEKHYGEEKNGCPLNQKISEMNLLKSKGFNIASLGIAVIDNPLIAATGHRICNDCMKSCIYQKQDPVNIPLVESNILESVLSLPWGVEIYLLLTKWNPLNIDSPVPKSDTGNDVMIVGLGPAGFALSHYLMNEGHSVTAVDGLKITPMDFDITKPIKHWQDIKTPLSEKLPQGFGGVAEYGITNRWDKNNLTLIRLLLERRNNFRIYGGIRFGSNITHSQAFDMGFDHVALCIGAGKPSFLKEADYSAKGIKTASDFLMNLQQGGSYMRGSNSNLLIRMPGVVIGCGLTAIDSAVELMHYYPVMVENFLTDWEKQDYPEKKLSQEDKEIAKELIEHAKLFRTCKSVEEKLEIINKLGGVTVCYRKTIKESPAYRLNHEEIEHAIALGIKFEEEISPQIIHKDQYNAIEAISFDNGKKIEAKTMLLAIGTESNEFLDIETSSDGISYFGDCDPKYAGSVVKALASSKDGYKAISESLSKESNKKSCLVHDIFNKKIKTHIHKINILSDNIVEIIVHSPLCADNFQAGQFFKLQNHSSDITKLIKPIALTGAYVDKEKGLISLIVLELGKSTRLCKGLQEGEEISLMGPTGMPTKIARNKKIALIGGGLGNAVLVPIAKALKENDCHVTYFAGYKKLKDRFYPERIEEFSDKVIYSCEEKIFQQRKNDDYNIKGNIIDGILYAKEYGVLDVDQIICIGSSHMMHAVSGKRKELFGNKAKMICSINSPMQCMMKGICGQCVQKVSDGRDYVFSCQYQDQNAEFVDFDALHSRLGQNSLFEKKDSYRTQYY